MDATLAAESAGFASRHGTHLLTVVVPSLAMAVFALGAELRVRLRGRTDRIVVPRSAATAAAVFSLLATAVHVAVAPEHFHEAVAFGVFFTVTSICQLAWAALMLGRLRRSVVVAGALGNAAIVVLWLYTRLVGVPVGPEAGETEAFGSLDVLSSAAEIGIVALTVWMLVRIRRYRVAAA